jgi:hypothetical protein
MKKIVLLAALVLGIAVSPAAAQEVTYNFDRDTDFSKFITYKWVDIKSVQQVDRITTRQIIFVVDAELAKRGLLKTDSDYADLYVGYQTALSRQTPWMAYRDGWGYGPAWGGGLAAIAGASINAGQLDVDVYATTEKKLVWRGAVSDAFDLSLNLDGSETKIQQSVQKLLQNYPPDPPKRTSSTLPVSSAPFAPSASSVPVADRQRELTDHRHAARCFFCRIAPALFHHRAPKDK